MPHDHHAHHAHIAPEAGDRAVAIAVGVNLALSLAEIVGGIFAGSVALIADAVHNLSDAAALGLAFAARRIGRRPTDAAMTFGYKRAELIAALINYVALILISLWLAFEAVARVISPGEVNGALVIWLAGIALLGNLATALLTLRLARESLNIRAAFLHNLADALASVAVIVVGIVVILWDWRLADPLITIGISGWILWTALGESRGVARILMLGSPPELDPAEVLAAMEEVPGVESVHHLHLWQISEHVASLEAHVVTAAPDRAGERAVKAALRQMLSARFGIGHITLDTETPAACCEDAAPIGGAAKPAQ